MSLTIVYVSNKGAVAMNYVSMCMCTCRAWTEICSPTRRTVPQVVTAKSGIKYSQPIKSASHMPLPEMQCAMHALPQLRSRPVKNQNQIWHADAHSCTCSAIRLRSMMLHAALLPCTESPTL